jgi:metal-responsive CopG/Arc/MetJ family transcriptional regulator
MDSETQQREAAEERMRITVYVDYEDLATLDELRAHVRRTERRNPDRSEIIRQAIRSYRDQQTPEGVGR